MQHQLAPNLFEFPKNIGDIVLCMGEGILNISKGSRYVVIHNPDIITKEIRHGGSYWVMTEENFKICNIRRGDVPMHRVRPIDMENADNFSWVGGIYKVYLTKYYQPGEDRTYP